MSDVFGEHRPTLVGAAYRILGSHADAEDVVQDAWIRWAATDPATVRSPRAFLLTVTTRLAINRLRDRQARREDYPGPWLPEPVATPSAATEGDSAVELAEEVSLAMLIVLESLSPLERAAFVLTDVFGMPSVEIGEALDRSPAAVRQLVHRARSHIRARAPRKHVDTEQHRRVTERFLAAAGTGDLPTLLAVLAPDVTLVSDGGGQVRAALRPIETSDKVARFLLGLLRAPGAPSYRPELRQVNGETAVVVTTDEGVDSVLFVTVDGDQVSALHTIRNPDKLTAL